MRLLSWNVNGLRAVEKKGFADWLLEEGPELLAIQETKADESQLSDGLKEIGPYKGYFSSGEKKGYSGTALYSKKPPLKIERGIGREEFDREGRILTAFYDDFILFNCYFPNGGASPERLQYKMDFYDAVLEYFQSLQHENLLICGDVNTAHQAIDLARPKENSMNTGFLDMEREWITKLLEAGFIDTFRHFHPDEEGRYSWWDYKTRARQRNVGWRLDYFFAANHMEDKLSTADILADVAGSDHCPIELVLK